MYGRSFQKQIWDLHVDKAPARPSPPISSPFDFTHLTQVDRRAASQLQGSDPRQVGEEWNRALRRESQLRPSTAHTHRSRSNSTVAVETRTPANPTVHSPTGSISETTICALSQASQPPPSPSALLSQSLPRHCLKIVEQPEDELAEGVPAGDLRGSVHAMSTDGNESVGAKSAGIDKATKDGCCGDTLELGTTASETASNVRIIQENSSTPGTIEPDQEDGGERRQLKMLTVRTRPLSQLSQYSDTLIGHFVVPPSPLARHGSIRSRRMSRRLSNLLRTQTNVTSDITSAIDSWEQDIDWCYEHEAETDCDFDWDKTSFHADNHSEKGQPTEEYPRAVLPLAAAPAAQGGILPTTTEAAEKRITGCFEDRLLLPPSPRFPSSPMIADFPRPPERPRDSGFVSTHSEEQSLVMKAGTTALHHRSTSTSSSLPDLGAGPEELCRVAKQLDEHIEALNKESYYLPTPLVIAKRKPSSPEKAKTRARADSVATCITLCSDNDIITPIETNEAITPASSTHNSVHLAKRSSSMAAGGRAEKGLSFPAAAIPGVIEFGPDEFPTICPPEEVEFVHFI
jgi:hypothetical protein